MSILDTTFAAADALWLHPEALREVPAAAAEWGWTQPTRDDLVFENAAGPEAVRAALRADADGRILFAWTPTARHLRTVFEIDDLADAVVDRDRELTRRALRGSALPFVGLVGLVVAGLAFWPEPRPQQMLALLLALLVGVPLWQRGVTRAWEAWHGQRARRRDPQAWRAAEARRVRFSAWAGSCQSWAAWGLAGMFAATFLVTVWTGLGPAVAEFGLVKERVRDGETWRLLTCAFLHANFVHLFFNASAGISLAAVARSLLDEARILLVFLVAAVAGSLASTFFMPGMPSIGASGGILGWGGLLLGLAIAHPSLRESGLAANILRWIVLLVVIGLAGAKFIDNAAHAGGLLAGLAMGLWYARDKRPLPRWQPALSRRGWAAVFAAGAAAWAWMLWILVRPKL